MKYSGNFSENDANLYDKIFAACIERKKSTQGCNIMHLLFIEHAMNTRASCDRFLKRLFVVITKLFFKIPTFTATRSDSNFSVLHVGRTTLSAQQFVVLKNTNALFTLAHLIYSHDRHFTTRKTNRPLHFF